MLLKNTELKLEQMFYNLLRPAWNSAYAHNNEIMYLMSMSFNSNQHVVAATDLTKIVSGPDGDLTILQGINMRVAAGESLALLGASGAGKSTLLGLLAGLDLPTTGSIELLGESLQGSTEDERSMLRVGRVGFVFQTFQLLPGLTALENVMLPLELAAQNSASELAQELLQRVGLENRMRHYPMQLSGGEQQRVAIARAFITKPKIVFADEPTGNLDQKTGSKIIDLIFDLQQQQNTTLLLVTHDSMLAARADRRLHLQVGKLISNTDVARE